VDLYLTVGRLHYLVFCDMAFYSERLQHRRTLPILLSGLVGNDSNVVVCPDCHNDSGFLGLKNSQPRKPSRNVIYTCDDNSQLWRNRPIDHAGDGRSDIK
jgi:hypothetical protein